MDKEKIEIKSLNIDRAEYEEIILSNSNHPNKQTNYVQKTQKSLEIKSLNDYER